jgi:DNA repair photolyase
MKRFTGHREPWGDFVDVKINTAELLEREVRRKKQGRVWISGVCDAYQPLERKYRLTGRCVKILAENGWRFTIQTKSPLVVRDIEILKKAADCEVGFTITTADEKVRRIFEPNAPSIAARVEALAALHDAGIRTFVMVAPLLPGAEGLVGMLKDRVDHVLIDRMNYHHADWVYKKYKMQWAMDDDFFYQKGKELQYAFEKAGIECQKLF